MAEAIENPIINSPFTEPTRHFRFDEDGITTDVVEERRPSAYFIPIPPSKRKSAQLDLEAEWTLDRIKANEFINRVRGRADRWRRGGHQHVTHTTRRLLEYWTEPTRERPLFFCQVEALETAIYVTEVAGKVGDNWIANQLRDESERYNAGLFRIAHKMATGTGKTVVMAMLIAWQVLNKQANPQDARFTESFLVVTPGITIRDRLRVLLPNDPNNYYGERDLVPAEHVAQLHRANIVITNFHAFQLRETIKAPKLTKEIAGRRDDAFVETPDQMVRRVCRELGTKRNVIVLNDEAHHCYRRREAEDEAKLTGDERKEAEARDKSARVWLAGLQAVQAKLGIKTVYDLSATPFFLQGSGYAEGTLFPWVASDFALIDAIEAGLVKIPRVPISDDSATGDTYRNLWTHIADDLPKKGRKTGADGPVEPRLPQRLDGALHSLYSDYEKEYERWKQRSEARDDGSTPPVFIVVCSNTAVSKLVFDWIAGWETETPDGSAVVKSGNLPLFSNEDHHRWVDRPNTILVDSEQLDSGEAMSAQFKAAAAVEIDRYKAEYRARFPGRDADDLTDQDLLREVMNTVGKPGRLGEGIRCVVSVSMLTEGWDANTVSHILGVRAFGTQLLCEQVVGRGLRRRSHVTDEDGRFTPEYAEVYGVPFSFIPTAGVTTDPPDRPTPTRIRALDDRKHAEIVFPHVVAYRYVLDGDRLTADFTDESRLRLTTDDIPSRVEQAGIVGDVEVHTLDDLRRVREQAVAFELTKRLLGQYRVANSAGDEIENGQGTNPTSSHPWLFPQALRIVRDWMSTRLDLGDDTFPQLLLIGSHADDAVARIHRGVVRSSEDGYTVRPVLRPYDPVGSTADVDFDTTRDTYKTNSDLCHVSHVVGDSGWELQLAEKLEHMDGLLAYVRNDHMGFTVPYTIDGEQHAYIPDFIVRLDDGRGADDPLHVVVEVSGKKRRDKDEKVATTKEMWIPAVNALGEFGRWDFVEISDMAGAVTEIRRTAGLELTSA